MDRLAPPQDDQVNFSSRTRLANQRAEVDRLANLLTLELKYDITRLQTCFLGGGRFLHIEYERSPRFGHSERRGDMLVDRNDLYAQITALGI